jgi:hypothetical protein
MYGMQSAHDRAFGTICGPPQRAHLLAAQYERTVG